VFGTILNDGTQSTLHQAVIEFLAMRGGASLNELNAQFHTSKDLLSVIRDLSVVTEYNEQLSSQSKDNRRNKPTLNSDGKEEYWNLIHHTLIVVTKCGSEIKYELSLFGVLLVLLLVHRHHRSKLNTNPNAPSGTSCLYYHEVSIKDYFDTVAHNYTNKLPLIFGRRWDLLKQELGSLLLDAFNFLFYPTGQYNSFNQSTWVGGNKEFYDDIRSLSDDTGLRLYPVFEDGLRVKKEFDGYLDDNRFREARLLLSKKLNQICNSLKYADISTFIQNLKRSGSLPLLLDLNYQINMEGISIIETIFRDELTFLFFLNLNVDKWHERIFEQNKYQNIESIFSDSGFTRYFEVMGEILQLGPPRRRLSRIFNKDNEVKQWFTEWIDSIANYRKETAQRMSNIVKEIYKPRISDSEFLEKKEGPRKRAPQTNPQIDTEYDVMNICSDIG
jgi:hypothetical protein